MKKKKDKSENSENNIAYLPTPPRPTVPPEGEAVDPCGHVANGLRIRDAFGDRLCYALGIGWLVRGDGGPWRPDQAAARRIVQGLGRVVTLEAADTAREAARCTGAPRGIELQATAVRLLKWAKQCEQTKNIDASMKEAAAHLTRLATDFDNDPLVLGCPDGLLDLRTGKLRAYVATDLVTKQIGCSFDLKAKCPRWLRFLEEVFDGDKEVIAYWQRFIGYCLTGEVAEHLLTICWGDGGNGKGAMLERTLRPLFGGYGVAAPPGLLTQQSGRNHPEEEAGLRGARLVVGGETEKGESLNESRVKRLTGGDTVSARDLYQKRIEFAPTHKLLLLTNHKPKIRGTDNGIWRRVRLVPFTKRFENKDEPTLETTLRAEWPGILNWALAGCMQYTKHHALGTAPKAIEACTAEYRDHENIVGQFISARCERGKGKDYRVARARLYDSYHTWCEADGAHAMTRQNFCEALRAEGFEETTIKGAPTLHSLRLLPTGKSRVR